MLSCFIHNSTTNEARKKNYCVGGCRGLNWQPTEFSSFIYHFSVSAFPGCEIRTLGASPEYESIIKSKWVAISALNNSFPFFSHFSFWEKKFFHFPQFFIHFFVIRSRINEKLWSSIFFGGFLFFGEKSDFSCWLIGIFWLFLNFFGRFGLIDWLIGIICGFFEGILWEIYWGLMLKKWQFLRLL